MEIEKLKKETIYQSFEDLGMETKNSKSKQKYEALNFNPKDKIILDVGCNTWYFPIRYSQNWAKKVYGIDVDRAGWAGMDVIRLAKWYAEHYGITNIEFYINSIFDELPYIKEELDAITCTSTFHYFREQQELFFEICNKLLKKWWELIWEWWLPEKSELYSRWVDEVPCRFPNEEELVKIAKWFKVVYKWKSVDQKWDKIPRYVLHFIKE